MLNLIISGHATVPTVAVCINNNSNRGQCTSLRGKDETVFSLSRS